MFIPRVCYKGTSDLGGDYNSGGNGLMGSRSFGDVKDAEDFFGVKYKMNGWEEKYDDENSDGAFKDWHEQTTQEERDASVHYTTGAYDIINGYLRDEKLDSAPQNIKDLVRNIDSSMRKFVLKEAITVWRGGSDLLIGGAKTVADINKMRGALVVDRGITSTAVTKDASWIDDGNMGYEIVYPKGRGSGIYIDPVSENHGEQEFMAARNTTYKVLGGYKDRSGHVICRLQAVYGKKKR